RRKRILQVLECLHGLAAEVARHFARGIDAELPRDIDRAPRTCRLDHVRVAWRLGNGRRVDEARRHGGPPVVDCLLSLTGRRIASAPRLSAATLPPPQGTRPGRSGRTTISRLGRFPASTTAHACTLVRLVRPHGAI